MELSTTVLLRDRIQTCSQRALACGALQPIATDYSFLEANGLRFLLRVLANVARKEKVTQAAKRRDPNFNPFLPYDPDLFVCDLSTSHVCLLNKFNVVDDHVLIVTRAFESQNHWLTIADFEALAVGLDQIDGLGFYNGGTAAGASQPHKHLQLVPLPLLPTGEALPVEAAIATVDVPTPLLNPLPQFEFRHSLVQFDWPLTGTQLHQYYRQLLIAVGFVEPGAIALPPGQEQTGAYNLLITRRWMLLIPRQRDDCHGISVNALGFAGTLFVKNANQQAQLTRLGPLALLQHVAVSQ